ncbi:CAC1S protein, partial [Centropus bengalensis]|nr:CAC1S protein [Centropus bengalensis]
IVTGAVSSSAHQWGESSDPCKSSTPAITFLIQEALISGGLGTLACDPSFVAVTRNEMAASSQLEMDEMEKAAVALLKGRETVQSASSASDPQDTSVASQAITPGLGANLSQETITATRL